MILALTLAGVLVTQPVDHVYFAGTWFAYSIGNKEFDCAGARGSVSGTQATINAAACTQGIFRSGF